MNGTRTGLRQELRSNLAVVAVSFGVSVGVTAIFSLLLGLGG